MNKPPEQLHLNVQLDDSVSLDKFIECDSTQDFLKILKNSIDDQSVSRFYFYGSYAFTYHVIQSY